MRADDDELGAAVHVLHEQRMHKYQSLDKRNCIVLSSQADWEAHEARIMQAVQQEHCAAERSVHGAAAATAPRNYLHGKLK